MTRRTLRKSHQTTIRFTEEMWIALEHAAARRGVSVAQFVRDAARAGLGEEDDLPDIQLAASDAMEVQRHGAVERTLDNAESTAALWEQGRLARERAKLLRDEAKKQRSRR